MLPGKKILLCVTGSIAAYKSVFLLRLLIRAGAEVKVIMTPAAKTFVTPLTFSSLAKSPVLSEIIDSDNWNNHVMLGRWADIILVAPCSCNTLGKMANGLCDNLLLAVYLSATSPVVVAPAMDEDMWHHPSTARNIEMLSVSGTNVLEVAHGELASGLIGDGRMAEPEEIVLYLEKFFSGKKLAGKKALVTGGPTYEHIDPVRFLGNHSSGKMGIAIAEALADEGAEVTLILGPSGLKANEKIAQINVVSAQDMFEETMKKFETSDITVMSAAVADYRPKTVAMEKIKKENEDLTLELEKTTDILAYAGKQKKADQLLIGFALETNNGEENALKKLKSKNADFIVLNHPGDGSGFGSNTNKITIFGKNGTRYTFDQKPKSGVAKDIADLIITALNA